MSRPDSVLAFPADFLWGSATAGHQVEGYNTASDWWALERSGCLPHVSGEACRHWELYEHDFGLASAAGQNAYRFSIEWSRIEPEPGVWSADAIRHYRRMIVALRSLGMEPIVTLHHFTLPEWVARRGGWAARATVDRFARFVEYVVRGLEDDEHEAVRYWVTVNEPMVYVKHGYVVGDWPPCRRRAWAAATRVLFNLARAHRAARDRIRTVHPRALVGFAHSAPWLQPCDPSRALDRLAAWLRDLVLNRVFFWLIGATSGGVRGGADFIGLNYYTRTIVRGGLKGWLPLIGSECESDHHPDRGPRSDTGWEVWPRGMTRVLRRFAVFGIPLVVTENGIATTDEDLRSRFLRDHLAAVGRAIREGIDVRGYMYWSLMDNFEWTLGTTVRFGLVEVDFATQERRARPALDVYHRICRTGRLVVADERGGSPTRREGPVAAAHGAAEPV